MKQVSLMVLLQCLIDGNSYSNIQAKDGDGYYHKVNMIDILNEEIKCEDGYSHYFYAFTDEGNNEMYID